MRGFPRAVAVAGAVFLTIGMGSPFLTLCVIVALLCVAVLA